MSKYPYYAPYACKSTSCKPFCSSLHGTGDGGLGSSSRGHFESDRHPRSVEFHPDRDKQPRPGRRVCAEGTQGAYTCTSALYSGGSISLLPNMAGFTNGQAFDINDSGQIVGTASDSTTYRGFLYNTGSYTNLGVLPGGTYSTASGINNLGQITGSSAGRGYFYSAGTMTDIGVLFPGPDSSSSGAAINNAGTIAGSSGYSVPSQVYHAVSWSNGTLTGYTEDPRTVSTAINNNGVLVGWGQYLVGSWAVLYDNGQRFDMAEALRNVFGANSAYSKAFGINDLNMVVGQVSVPSSPGGPLEGPLAYVYNYNSISVPGTGYLLRDLVTLSDGTTPGFTSLETAPRHQQPRPDHRHGHLFRRNEQLLRALRASGRRCARALDARSLCCCRSGCGTSLSQAGASCHCLISQEILFSTRWCAVYCVGNASRHR